MKYSKLCASSLSDSREEKSMKLTLLLSIDHPQVIPAGSRLINWEGLEKKKKKKTILSKVLIYPLKCFSGCHLDREL